jgi:hypothetical protein
MTLSVLALLVVAQSQARPTAASWAEHLLIADGDGTVSAFSSKDLTFDATLTKKLNGDGLLAIARSGDVLWGFDGARAFTWDDAGARWDLVKSKPPPKPCSAFAVVGGAPVGTCGPGVHRFTDGKYWDAPEFKGQISGRGFGDFPQAIASHGTQLAIGTGFGEWGGHLFVLDVSTGKWVMHTDTLGNGVGIAWTGEGWAVAWSMSHMMAHTRVRLHGPDGKPLREGAMLRDKYLRKLAWDDEAHALFGLEQNDLVCIDDKLELTKVQDVGKVKYGPEPNAVGVSPGIAELLALGGGRFLVVPLTGDALVVGAGKVTPLRAPAVDAGVPARK